MFAKQRTFHKNAKHIITFDNEALKKIESIKTKKAAFKGKIQVNYFLLRNGL